MSSISADKLAVEIKATLEAYAEGVNEAVDREAQEAAKMCAKSIKQKAQSLFRGTGKYAKDWTQKKTSGGVASSTEYTVYNRKHYRLAHLLEYGHAKVNGGRVEGKAHIRPAAEEAIKQFESNIKKDIQQ